MLRCRQSGADSAEAHETSRQVPRRNWVMVTLVQVIVASSYSFIFPSMYQFITTPKSPPEDTLNSTQYWPGLGEPQIFYSLAVSAFPVGEMVSAFAAACLSRPFPYFYNILFTCAVGGAGGVLYALAINGWMVITARFLSGACAGFGVVFTQSYIGRTAENSPKGGRSKKELQFLLYSATVNVSYIAATGLSALVSQFPSVNPYRCGGWFILSIALLYAFVFVIAYSETESIRSKFRQTCSSHPKCGGKRTLQYTKMKKISVKWCSTFSVVVIYVYVHSMTYAVMDFVNPILSDQFGLDVESISYYMLGIMVVWTFASVVLILMAILKIESRIGLVSVMLLALIGSFLLADWQGFGSNPCSIDSTVITGDMLQNNSSANNGSTLHTSASGSGSGLAEWIWLDNDTNASGINDLLSLVHSEVCESQSTSEHKCFWNPESRVTGEQCTTCRPVCLSKQKSLNFIQFSIGMLIITIIIQPGLVFYSVVASNITKRRYQETIMGILYAVGGLSRTLTPLWGIAIYEKSAQHTYIPMSVMAAAFAVVTVLIILFYNWMAPRTFRPTSLIVAPFYPVARQHIPSTEEELSSAKLFRDSIQRWLDASNSSTSFQGSKCEDTFTDIIYPEPIQQKAPVVAFKIGDSETLTPEHML